MAGYVGRYIKYMYVLLLPGVSKLAEKLNTSFAYCYLCKKWVVLRNYISANTRHSFPLLNEDVPPTRDSIAI